MLPSPELDLIHALLDAPVLLCFYHQRIVLERTERADEYLSAEEIDATMGGRIHGDGRRLDQYVSTEG